MLFSTDEALGQDAFNDFEVRSGFSEDIEAMALLTERSSADRAGEPLPVTIPDGSEDYGDLIERQRYAGYWSHLVFDGNRLAGFTTGYPGTWKGEDDESNAEYLWLLMVDPDYQKRGLGRALLRLAGAAAYETGANSVVLYAATDNVNAIGLYEAEGYKQVNTVTSDRQGKLGKYVLEVS